MEAIPVGNSTIYGYNDTVNALTVNKDIPELYTRATRHEENGKRKPRDLVLFGGVHGMKETGIPTGESGGGSLLFRKQDIENKTGSTSLTFAYYSLFKDVDLKGEISPERILEARQKILSIEQRKESLILLTWCYSHMWAKSFFK